MHKPKPIDISKIKLPDSIVEGKYDRLTIKMGLIKR